MGTTVRNRHVMDDKLLSALFVVLSDKQGPAWDNTQADAYHEVVASWEDDLARKVMSELFYTYDSPFRPRPSELLHLAARLASPRPASCEVYDEVIRLSERYGEYGVTHRGVRLPGDPPYSHPIVGRVVSLLGGWSRVCLWNERSEGSLARRIDAAHKTAETLWQREVMAQLRQPESERDAYYFPKEAERRFLPKETKVEQPKALEPARIPPPRSTVGSLQRIGLNI